MTPEREEKINRVLSQRQPDLTLVFENVWDPHNISAVLRTADAVGVMEVYVLYTQDVKRTKLGRRSSSSAKKWITPHYFYEIDACVQAIRTRYDKIYATQLSADAKSLYELDLTESVALVFGNESAGISQELTRLCDGNFIIPMHGMVQSLNISVACAVSLYEAQRQRNVKGFYEQSRLAQNDFEQLRTEWMNK
ncbi:MAG: RNA methyltransferase [Bacteroidetes bacterium]|nr:RNA methyltransferase [Bacteroidota bacterium]